MTTLGYDAYPNAKAAAELGFKYAGLTELLAASDFISLHAPATPETFHLLGADQFTAMKSGALVVNTARGSLIDTPALIDALHSGKIAGAGLDVLEGEEYEQTEAELNLLHSQQLDDEAKAVLNLDILSRLPNVIVTSHNAYNSAEALERIRQTTIENIKAVQDQKPQNLVRK
jgi:D-lactate dehydrogenase